MFGLLAQAKLHAASPALLAEASSHELFMIINSFLSPHSLFLTSFRVAQIWLHKLEAQLCIHGKYTPGQKLFLFLLLEQFHHPFHMGWTEGSDESVECQGSEGIHRLRLPRPAHLQLPLSANGLRTSQVPDTRLCVTIL